MLKLLEAKNVGVVVVPESPLVSNVNVETEAMVSSSMLSFQLPAREKSFGSMRIVEIGTTSKACEDILMKGLREMLREKYYGLTHGQRQRIIQY